MADRLRWHPGLYSGDHVVAYEDRFLGVREREWKSILSYPREAYTRKRSFFQGPAGWGRVPIWPLVPSNERERERKRERNRRKMKVEIAANQSN
ncbi:hypothetical protein GGR56DRAFT_174214 [Xylariaceae sp. FL0804]|nr:hypothetical protein GGR56DRAFT_174214 [Xylariaceae sp. FL0804]